MLKNLVGGSSNQESGTHDASRRRELGIYYTPSRAADILAAWAIREKSDTVLEPSFGGCSLLAAAVKRLTDLGCKHPDRQLVGFDVDNAAFQYLDRLLGTRAKSTEQFSRRDFLLSDATAAKKVSTVIANPPFVSWHRMSKGQRAAVAKWRDRNGASFPLTASLWAYFLTHSMAYLRNGGRLAFVLPASALSADYGKVAVECVARQFEEVLVFRVSEQLFIQSGAQERAVVFLAQGYQEHSLKASSIREYCVATLDELQAIVARKDRAADSTSNDESLESARTELANLRASGNAGQLGSVARISIGEVVGDVKFFVKTLGEWEALRIRAETFSPLITSARQLAGIRLTQPEIMSSYSRVPRLLRVAARQIPRELKNYLDSYPKDARERNVTFGKRTPWYAVSYDNSCKAFVASLSHLSPRIVLNTAKISCANALYKLAPMQGKTWTPALSLASLTTIWQLSAEAMARTKGSGALKLEPADMRWLDFPAVALELPVDVIRVTIERVDAMLRAGEKDLATRVADKTLLLDTKVISAKQLQAMRDQVNSLRRVRIG